MALWSLEATSAETTDGRRVAAVDRARVPDVSAVEGMFAMLIGQTVGCTSKWKQVCEGFGCDVMRCWWQNGKKEGQRDGEELPPVRLGSKRSPDPERPENVTLLFFLPN
jgi:hypothetical protein